MTKERPIIFSGPMVRAILEGRKTQTRRIVKLGPNDDVCTKCGQDGEDDMPPWPVADGEEWMKCPYGAVGDRLWVRENFNVIVHSDCMDEDRVSITYRADNKTSLIQLDTEKQWTQAERLRKHDTVPSIHMPRWASRITLELTNVRVERLWAISDEDAKAEGAIDNGEGYRKSFGTIWSKINGLMSLTENPWHWVLEFKHIEAEA